MGDTDLTECIRRRAYKIWESEGRLHGCDVVYWLRAEAEVLESLRAPSSTAKEPKPTTKPTRKNVPSSRLRSKSSKTRLPKK